MFLLLSKVRCNSCGPSKLSGCIWVRIGKFEPLREPIRMLLFSADQCSYVIKKKFLPCTDFNIPVRDFFSLATEAMFTRDPNGSDPILERTISVHTVPFRLSTSVYTGPVWYCSVLNRSKKSSCFYQLSMRRTHVVAFKMAPKC